MRTRKSKSYALVLKLKDEKTRILGTAENTIFAGEKQTAAKRLGKGKEKKQGHEGIFAGDTKSFGD